jgi:hypothetical protein
MPRAWLVTSIVCFGAFVGGCGADGADGSGVDDDEQSIADGWSCDGTTGRTKSPRGTYYMTSFGCWVDDNGQRHGDSGDNCEPACLGQLTVCAGRSGPECERELNWYAADADRFGCGKRLRVTNPMNGQSAIVMSIDRGPACRIESSVSAYVLDLSMPASNHLFGGSRGAGERALLFVQEMGDDAPLGPTTAPAQPPPGAHVPSSAHKPPPR